MKRKYLCDDDGESSHRLATDKRRRYDPPRHLSPPRSESPPADRAGDQPRQHLSPPLSPPSPPTPQSARAGDAHSATIFSAKWPSQFNSHTGTQLADPELLIARLQQVERHRESGLEHSWRVAKYGEEVALMYPGNLTPPYIREEWWRDQQRKEDELWQEIDESDCEWQEERNDDSGEHDTCDAQSEGQGGCEDTRKEQEEGVDGTDNQLELEKSHVGDEGLARNRSHESVKEARDADVPDPGTADQNQAEGAAGSQSGDDTTTRMKPVGPLGEPDAAEEEEEQRTNDKVVKTHDTEEQDAVAA
ncbi:hypothetical protein AC578_1459 [Pseudocercospora eumusae]|uniref:Uncharacterized protein n=1 Tax=Pseudocercospora eumusae TaxID=321146 RepID=A0A139H6T3_9PEZI|nr:hypothetical protein AC578_1459 [Pseudocercospora eumusae]